MSENLCSYHSEHESRIKKLEDSQEKLFERTDIVSSINTKLVNIKESLDKIESKMEAKNEQMRQEIEELKKEAARKNDNIIQTAVNFIVCTVIGFVIARFFK